MIPQIVILVILLASSAFFSGSETAFFSLNHFEKEKLNSGARGRRNRFIRSILENPAEILITILTGNVIVNLFFASLMDRFVARFVESYAWVYAILAGTSLVLVFGEMTPKNFAIRHSLRVFDVSSRPLRGLHSLLAPVRYLLKLIEKVILRILTARLHPEREDSRSLISSTMQIGLKKGIVHSSELSILDSFLDFREKTAEEVMIPRIEITAIEAKEKLSSLFDLAKKNGTDELIPVYRETIDRIIGYVNLRDLLPYRYGLATARTIAPLVRPIHPVPESKNLMELLREITEIKCQMALVIDEYGGTAGIVTYQHLVEDFLYFFYPSKSSYFEVDDSTFRFPGEFELERVEELLGVEFESESRTVSGFVTEMLEEIPAVGAILEAAEIVFTVKAVSRRKILEVEARRPG